MNTLLDFLPAFCALAAILTLIALSIIDLRHWILPNKLNLTLGLLGAGFHASTGFLFFPPIELLLGGLIGSGILYIVRFFGNRHYQQETLGLGDVKLLGAAGLWLGTEGIVFAITVGAFAGLIHGLVVAFSRALREKRRPNLKRLMIPAGPGFCIGILATGFWQYWGYFME